MATEFDIGILSKLQIDPKSSATDINKVIKSSGFTNQLDAVAVSLEASMTQKELASFRRSVRDITSSAFGEGKQPTVKVGVEINQGQAVKSINSALTQAAKQLKSIKVDIDARVDKDKLKEQLRQPKVSSSPNVSTGSEVGDIGRAKDAQDSLNRSKREGQNITSQTNKSLDEINNRLDQQVAKANSIGRSYENVNQFIDSAVQSAGKHGQVLDHTVTEMTNLENGHKRVTLELKRYNDELKRIESQKITANLDETGKVTPKSITVNKEEAAKLAQSQRAGSAALERAIAANEKLIAQSSPIKATLEEQNRAYKKLQDSMEFTNKSAQKLIASNNLAKVAAKQQADATALQTKLQNDYAKAMQQNARHIDKGGMKDLIQQIKQVDVTSNTALNSLKGQQAQMQGYVNQAAQATRSQMGIMENFQNALVKFPIWMGASTLFFGAIRSAKEFTTTIIEIDSRMTTLQKVMSDSANMDETWNDATVAAQRYGQTLRDVLDSYAEFARQGFEGVDLSNFGNAALMASNVGEIGVQQASEFLTAASAQWQTDSQEAMNQVDSWNEIANNYATTVEKLGEGQAKAGSSARAMGLDFDETNAVIGALTAQTKQSGSEIGNFIKAVFPRAYTVSRSVFEDLGISIENANGQTRSAIDLYTEAAHAIEGMSKADQADVVRGLGGTHHYQRMQVLLDTLRETGGLYDQILESSRNAEGSAAAENAVYMQSLEANINKAKVAIEEFSLALGEAFLESGILNFLTLFTNFMTTLTKGFTDLSPVVRNVGVGLFIATLASGSKRVREFYGVLTTLSDRFRDIKARADAATSAAASFNRFDRVAKAPSANVTFATGDMAKSSTALSQQAQQTMILTNAQKQLSNAQKGTSATTQSIATTTTTLSGAQKVATGTSVALSGALRGIMAATGVGLVIAGITWGLEKLIGKMADSSRAANEFAQTQDILKQALEQDSERVEELVKNYSRLHDTIQNGELDVDYNTEDLEEYNGLTKEMSALFPDLVSGSGEYGATLKNQEGIIQARINLLERQIEVEKELALQQQEQARLDSIEAGEKAEKQIASGTFFDNDSLETMKKFLGDTDLSKSFPHLEEQKNNIISINEAAEYYNGLVQMRNQYEKQGKEINAEALKQIETQINIMDGYMPGLQAEALTVQTALDGVAQGFLNNVSEYLAGQQTLGESASQVFGNLSVAIGSSEIKIGQAKDAYTDLMSSIQNDTDFVAQMSNYEGAVEGFNEALRSGADATELKPHFEAVKAEFAALSEYITTSLSASGVDDAVIQQIVSSLEAQQLAMLNVNSETFDGIENQEDLENALAETTDAVDEQAYAWQKAQGALSDYTDEIRALEGEMGTIEKAIDQLAQTGSLDLGTMADVLDIFPELSSAIGDSDLMMQMLQGRYGELGDAATQTMAEQIYAARVAAEEEKDASLDKESTKLAQNAGYVEGANSNEADLVDSVAGHNETEVANSEAKEVAKTEQTGTRVQGEDQMEADLTDAKGEHYETDYSNFNMLNATKESTQGALMETFDGWWGTFFASVYGKAIDAISKVRGMLGIGDDDFVAAPDLDTTPKAYSDTSINLAGLDIKKAETKTKDIQKIVDEIRASNPDFDKSIRDNVDAVNNLADAGAGSGKSLKDVKDAMNGTSKAAKENAKETEKAKDKIKDLDVEVETLTKTFQKQTFILNQHEERLRKINHQIEKQNLQTERYAKHSANYRKALQKENKLNQQKLKAMQAQEKSLSNQIKRGRINEYGLVSEDVNVRYNQYNTSSSGSGSTTRTTGQVRAAGGSGKVSPFAGWKVNYGYSPQGGGAYGSRIGFNGGRHYGIDFGGRTGQAIRTPHGGTVVKAGWSPYGGGNQVEVYNKAMNKTFTFMHMLGDLAVKTGQQIQAGQQVGRMGSTGNSTGTHLHFQVNTGRGVNNATSVNPNAYLSSGSGSIISAASSAVKGTNLTTGTTPQIGKSISEKTASYLNDVEKARLDAIEQAVNKHNAGEENKSKVQEARENLDKMELERLKLVAQIREIEYQVIESQIEAFEVSKNKLNHRISELEYKADNSARLAGKTSDSAEWRKWMNKAQTEREKQLRFQQNQVKYIEGVLRADSKKNPANRMNEAHRFQLEEQMRSAKEEMISLRRAVDESIASILTSRVNQSFKEIDKALENIDNKITLITHKRHFLDSTYQDGAGKYRNSLNQEIKMLQQREKEYNKSIKTLKNLRSNLKQQPELYEQVNDKLKESQQGLRDVEAAIYDLRKEGQSLELDKMFERLNKRLDKAKTKFDELQDRAHYINRDLQPDLYFDNQADILQEMADYQKIIKNNIVQLESMRKKVKQFPDLHKQVTDEIKNWQDQLKTTNQEMHTMRQEFASSFVDSVKQIYQVQRDQAIKAIDDELSEFEKMINKKIELIDKQHREETYQEDINDRQEELQKLRNEIAQRMGDDSLQNQRILKDLQEELAEKEKDYNKFIADKQREDKKEALNEELKDAQEQAEAQKESTNKAYDDLLNDQREFNKMQEEIMKGQIDKYKGLYKELTDFIGENMKDIGRSVSEGLLDGINTPFEALKELTKIMDALNKGDVPVLESGLKPTTPKLDSPLLDLMKGVDNNFTLNNLGLSPSLPKLDKSDSAPSTTNNNSYNLNSLLNVENFRGTKSEQDKLLNNLVTELRKLGVTI